jgi:hypothetical protein
MPILSYTKEIAKKLKKGAGQTIRPAGKRKYKTGDTLYHYTGPYKPGERVKLGESTVSKVVPIIITRSPDLHGGLDLYISSSKRLFLYHHEVTQLAQDDGFTSLREMFDFFIKTYNLKPGDSKYFQIIKWRDFKPADWGGNKAVFGPAIDKVWTSASHAGVGL